MSHVLDIHLRIHSPYTQLLRENEEILWELRDKVSRKGGPSHYKTETLKHCIYLANKVLKQQKAAKDALPPEPPELTAEEIIASS